MKNILILIIGLAIGAGGFWLISSHRPENAAHEKAEAEKPSEEKSGHDADVIKLDKKQQTAANVETALPQPTRLPEEAKGYGRILDPAQFVSLVLDVQAARATADASKKEADRLKTLYAQGQNASARALETAEATAKRDETLSNVAEAKLRTSLGPSIVARKDFSEMIDALSKMQWALARIDLLSAGQEEFGSTIHIASLSNEKATIDAELLGPAPAADASIQGRGFLALIKTNSLTPNTTIVGFLEIPAQPQSGFLVPAKALLQEGDETIVLTQIADDNFKKAPIEISRMTDQGAFVTEGLAATNRIVVNGAHQILSVTKAEAAD
jgi:hypothetical protein